MAFKLRYVDGITGPTSPALLLGQVVHLGIEWHYRHRQLGAAVPASEVTRQVGQLWGEVVDCTPNVLARIIHKFEPVCRKRIGTNELDLSYPEHHDLVGGISSPVVR